ncbi:MAG TPA: hypothetical protein DDW27_20800 [Bacteroidales bacterium]|nr:hypothetical protein [Bacteroidales bacterium]
MNETILYAPQLDSIIKRFDTKNNPITPEMYQKLSDIYDIFSFIKPGKEDDIRHTWLEVERGPVEAFGSFEEYKEDEEVETIEEFEQLWKEYYPEETKWYEFGTSRYRSERYFFFDDKLFAIVNEEDPPSDNNVYYSEDLKIFIDWLHERIAFEINKLRENPQEYNDNIKRNLSWGKRYGRIRRKELWNILGEEAIRIDLNLGEEKIQILREIVGEMPGTSETGFKNMTANEFFRICEFCYDANDYFMDQKTGLKPLEKYLKMSDGRDAGLRNIPGNSQEAFYKWYHGEAVVGAHPWEICRGGNSTHISLFVSETENKWKITLAGSSIGRVEETVRMAVALHDNKIPFELRDAEEILNMVTGNDFIGIVPDNVFPRYCHNLFPREDRIIDFMNLNFFDEFIPEIINKTYWYPLEEIVPAD